jgi:hypothetical protein
MTRSVALLFALLTGCTVGEAPTTTDGGGSGSNNGDDRNVCVNRVAAPATAHDHGATNGTRARQGCQDAGCHAVGGTGGVFAFSGTVYKETSAITPAAGVTVRIFKPGNNKSLASTVTDNAGNFNIKGTFTDFPYITDVTACGTSTTIRPMVSMISAGDANCNLGGSCHGAAGTQGAVYLGD